MFSTLYLSIACWLRIDLDKYDMIHGMLIPVSSITFGLWSLDELYAPLVPTSHGTPYDEMKLTTVPPKIDMYRF